MLSFSDVVLLAVLGAVGYWYFIYNSAPATAQSAVKGSSSGAPTANGSAASAEDVEDAGRDFVKALALAVRSFLSSLVGTRSCQC